jgi:hypothetical protein
VTGLEASLAFSGVSFSCVFDAELVVGLIILARNPSSAGATFLLKLLLEGCFFTAGGGPIDDLPRAVIDGCLRTGASVFAAAVLLGDRDLVAAGWEGPAVWRTGAAGAELLLSLERDEVVGAVIDGGSFTGFVGDFGRGLTKPVELAVPVLVVCFFVAAADWCLCGLGTLADAVGMTVFVAVGLTASLEDVAAGLVVMGLT